MYQNPCSEQKCQFLSSTLLTITGPFLQSPAERRVPAVYNNNGPNVKPCGAQVNKE